LPELNTGTKSDFKKLENLPAGIENIFGKMPSKENGFYKFSFPRQDISVTLDGVKIDPRFAFTTWFVFMPMDSAGISGELMGDVILLESECKNVLKKEAPIMLHQIASNKKSRNFRDQNFLHQYYLID